MIVTNTDTKKRSLAFRKIFMQYLLVLVVCYAVALLVAPRLWARNVYLMHTVCIFIAFSTFLIIWNSAKTQLDKVREYSEVISSAIDDTTKKPQNCGF